MLPRVPRAHILVPLLDAGQYGTEFNASHARFGFSSWLPFSPSLLECEHSCALYIGNKQLFVIFKQLIAFLKSG